MIMPARIVAASFKLNASSSERCRDTKIAIMQCAMQSTLMLVGRSYRVNCMGGAIDYRISSLKTSSCSCLLQVKIDTGHTAAGLLEIGAGLAILYTM